MKKNSVQKKWIGLLALGVMLVSCSTPEKELNLVDPNATEETKALLQNLHGMAGNNALFGHQARHLFGLST